MTVLQRSLVLLNAGEFRVWPAGVMSELDHVSSADEANESYFEDGGNTFGDSFLDGDSDSGDDDGEGTAASHHARPPCAEPPSAASSPIEPAAVPDSPPETPAAQTPPESPPHVAAPCSVQLDSPPKSPALDQAVDQDEKVDVTDDVAPSRRPVELPSLDNELLDFEADAPAAVAAVDAPDKCDGECDDDEETTAAAATAASDGGESLEEGEVSDDQDKALLDTPKSVCRFFNKGQCTWGISCRFIHPGVTDKGNYNMFAPVKNRQSSSSVPAETDKTNDKREDVNVDQGAGGAGKEGTWERAMREAKERLRRASKRRQTDADFEEKKMNLGLAQADADRENDYYTRAASPVRPSTPPELHLRAEHRRGADPFDPYEPRHRSPSPRPPAAVSPPGPYRVGYPPPPPPPMQHRPPPYQQSQYMLCSSGQVRRVPPPPPPPSSQAVPEVWGRSGPRGRIAPPHPGLAGRLARGGGWPPHVHGRPPHEDRLRDWKQERYEEVSLARRGRGVDDFVDPWMRGRSPPPAHRSSSRRSYSSGSSRRSRSSRSGSSSSGSSAGSRSYSSSRSRSASSASHSDQSGGSRHHHRRRHRRRHRSGRHHSPRHQRRQARSRSSGSSSPPHSGAPRRRVGACKSSSPVSPAAAGPTATAAAVKTGRTAGGRQRFASHTLGAMLARDGAARGAASSTATATNGAASSAGVGRDAAETDQSSSTAATRLDPAVRRLATATAALEKARQESEATRKAGVGPAATLSRCKTGDGDGAAGRGASSEASRRSAASVAALAAKALQDSARRSLAAAKNLSTASVSAAAAAVRSGTSSTTAGKQSKRAEPVSVSVTRSLDVAGRDTGSRGTRRSHPAASSAAVHSQSSQAQRQPVGRTARQNRRGSSSRSSCSSSSSRSSSSQSSRSPSKSPRRKRTADVKPGRTQNNSSSSSSTTTLGVKHSGAAAQVPSSTSSVPARAVRQVKTAAAAVRPPPLTSDQRPIDVLAEGGKKRQIKLTLRAPTSLQASQRVVERLAGDADDDDTSAAATSRKRPAPADEPAATQDEAASKRPAKMQAVESRTTAAAIPADTSKTAPVSETATGPRPVAKKTSSSRREELMKQLKAVEDAISKKRTT